MLPPYRLVSLWEIMELVKVDELLGSVREICNDAQMVGAFKDSPDNIEWLKRLQNAYETLATHCDQLNLDVAAEQIKAQLRVFELSPGHVYPEIAERAAQMIASTIETQLKLKLFFVLPSESRKFYLEPTLFGAEVEDAFPSASPEIAEAGKCIACGRHSAAVYHLMRTLEVGINCLAKEFAVSSAHRNWENVLNDIQKAVGAMNSTTHGATWKDSQQFYSEACAHFMFLKNGWRNYAMHLHERYDSERSLDIYNSVRAFMRHLAKRLHE